MVRGVSKNIRSSSGEGVPKTLAVCRSYRDTTEMLAVLGTIFKNHCNASICIGRVARREAGGGIASDPVTPDMMAQGNGMSVVVEIKAGFPFGVRPRQKIFDQLKKYDCRLAGWTESDVDRHDIMVLTRIQSAVEMSDYLESKGGVRGRAFSNPLCVTEFAKLGRYETTFFVRIASGSLTDTELHSSMRHGIEVSAKSIVFGFSTLWFYDSEPDPPYTMSILWERIFPGEIAEARTGGSKQTATPLHTTIDDIMEDFRTIVYPESPAPRRKWAVKAMDGLVKIKMARKEADGSYTVYYFAIRDDDPLEVFARMWETALQG